MDKQRLQNDLKESMLAKDVVRTSVLRMLISAINYYEIQKGGANYVATAEDVLKVIQAQAKQRKDSIEQFEKANRPDLADKELVELKILEGYLPEQMPEDEIKKIVESTIAETNATSMHDMGKVMGRLNEKLKDKADMGVVSNLVKSKLQS